MHLKEIRENFDAERGLTWECVSGEIDNRLPANAWRNQIREALPVITTASRGGGGTDV
jgi:hypothetical protein